MKKKLFLQNLASVKYDLPASIVVFFVALPLCLGIALASGAPLFSGIIAGIIGGVVVGSISGSPLGVSGPATGLVAIVMSSLATLGSWEAFLLAIILAGILQLISGYLGGGMIASYFPSSVIKGMLVGIGLLIILKQIPHALGYDATPMGHFAFHQAAQLNVFFVLPNVMHFINPGALFITIVSMFILIFWEQVLMKKHKVFRVIQGALVAVIVGIILNWCYQKGILHFNLNATQIVTVPVSSTLDAFFNQFTFPDFSQLTNIKIYKIALTIAIIASLETLLCVEATDKLDPHKRVTPTNRELKAQGVGNIISGMIGGLPITQVIVRSSANIDFGAKTKMSAIYHGIFLLICVLTISRLLNMIPLATLASILFSVGYKLAKPSLFMRMYKLGWEQFIPFMTTIVTMLFTDLLIGVAMGVVVFIIIKYRKSLEPV